MPTPHPAACLRGRPHPTLAAALVLALALSLTAVLGGDPANAAPAAAGFTVPAQPTTPSPPSATPSPSADPVACTGPDCIPQPSTPPAPPAAAPISGPPGQPGGAGDTATECGITNIGGCVATAIDDFFRGVVTAALNPLLELLSATLLTTPPPESLPRVGRVVEPVLGDPAGLLRPAGDDCRGAADGP